jgi:CRP-like cAMP-binding protein
MKDWHDLIDAGFVAKRYPAGHIHFPADDRKERSFVIQEGWCAIEKYLSDGKRQIVDFCLPGDLIERSSNKALNALPFRMITDTVILEGNGEQMATAEKTFPELRQKVADKRSRQWAIVVEHLSNLGRRSALSRTAHLLIELSERQCVSLNGNRLRFGCPLTQYDLADALGLTPIHVNRMLRELRERGLLEFRSGWIEILEPARLMSFASFDAAYLVDDAVGAQ